MLHDADAGHPTVDPYLDTLVLPALSRRERPRRRRARPAASRLGVLVVGTLATTVAATIGGAAFTLARPADRAEATTMVRELLIVSQPGSADSADASPSPSTAALADAKPRPVAGVSQAAMDNAAVIVAVGKQLGLSRRAYVVAVMTALQETALRNLANSAVPESLNYPHQGVHRNYDSLGLFQQRPSQGWGTVAELMDPATATRLFYARLVKVPDWQNLSVGDAAQSVQRSAYPRAYDKQRVRAEQIVDAIG